MTKPLCDKHREDVREWTEWGPFRPRPRHISRALCKQQEEMIRSWCAAGRNCLDYENHDVP